MRVELISRSNEVSELILSLSSTSGRISAFDKPPSIVILVDQAVNPSEPKLVEQPVADEGEKSGQLALAFLSLLNFRAVLSPEGRI